MMLGGDEGPGVCGMAVRSKESTGRSATKALRPPVKERLLRVATRLFARHGFKDDLLYEVYHQLLSMQTAHLDEIASGPGTAEDRLRAAAADVVITSLENLDDGIVFFRSLHMLPDDKQTQVRAERRLYHEKFKALVDEGIATGTFRSDIASDIVVHYYLSVVNQLGIWYKPEGSLSPTQVADIYTELLIGGLAAR